MSFSEQVPSPAAAAAVQGYEPGNRRHVLRQRPQSLHAQLDC